MATFPPRTVPPRSAGAAALLPLCFLVACTGPEESEASTDRTAHGDAAEHPQGAVHADISCSPAAQAHFEEGLTHLHHMMYEQARPEFRQASEADPSCAMAHWGIAMTSFQPLWHPTSDDGLERGQEAVRRAQALGATTDREARYLEAVGAFFTDPDPAEESRPADHRARLEAWESAQRALHEAHPDDVDAAALYALAQVAHAMALYSPAETPDRSRQIRAGELLERYFRDHPEHPGLHHYLIHAYDTPDLAYRAEDVARRYDALAPETTHALHMPSHIFVRLGEWEETVALNTRSAEAALGHPVNGLTSMHHAHALDYMMYGYLQKGNEAGARETLERVEGIERSEGTFAAAYGMAAARARYVLERGDWEAAARLAPRTPDALAWEAHPAAEALIHYARGLGAARTGDLDQAVSERARLDEAVRTLREGGDTYWAAMTEALGKGVEGWILHERGETDRALALLEDAADLEESMDKHPITPGEIFPVRELLGELLLQEGRAEEARRAFEISLARTPDRRNALMGVERATRPDG